MSLPMSEIGESPWQPNLKTRLAFKWCSNSTEVRSGRLKEGASPLDWNAQVPVVHVETPGRDLWAKGAAWRRAQRAVTVALNLGSLEFLAWLVGCSHSEERVGSE